MPTPKLGYFVDGERVPGVTTVLSRFKESGALIYWSWNLGMQGIDYRKASEDACNTGTLVHQMIEDDLHGKFEFYDDPKANQAYDNYRQWLDMTGCTITPYEKPLVSKEYKFGGTPDALMTDRHGNIFLIDWKTANGVYAENIIQGAAYKYLIEEAEGIKLNGFHLCRFTKEDGDFHHHFFSDLEDGWKAFRLMRELYDLDKVLKKRC